MPRRGSTLVASTRSATVRLPSPITWAGTRCATAGHLTADDQAPVVVAGEERLDDYPAARDCSLRERERLAHASSSAGRGTPLGRGCRRAASSRPESRCVCATVAAWSSVRTTSGGGPGGRRRRSSRVVSSLSEAMSTASELVSRRHGGADPLRVDALPELDERLLVETDPRDVARTPPRRGSPAWTGRRPCARPAGRSSRAPLEVERRVGLDEVVHQADGQAARGEANLLLDVAVDDVVAARLPGHLRVLPRRMSGPTSRCSSQGHVLGNVAEPGALV